MPSDSTIKIIFSYGFLIFWMLSLGLFWILKDKVSQKVETQARYFLTYIIISGLLVINLKGKELGLSTDFIPNITTEIIGIGLGVFLIDRVYNHVSAKNEETYRLISLRVCKMPLYTYCVSWLYLFEPDGNKLNKKLQEYNDFGSFFKSDDFYRQITNFDFNRLIGADKTYAQYYSETFTKTTDRFQSILSKYASKLSQEDIPLIEHFGGRAFMFTAFEIMRFISETNFTSQSNNGPTIAIRPFNNSLRKINRENINKHFDRLVNLINQYNSAVTSEDDKWTIKNISKLQTIESANDNVATQW